MNRTQSRYVIFFRRFLISITALLFVGMAPAQSFGKTKEKAALSSARLGAGRGIPYGGKGGNLEFVWGDQFGLTGGMGLSRPEGRHWAVGARVYARKLKSGFNPRVSGLYGAVGRIRDAAGTSEKILKGTVLGVGFDWRLTTRLSFDFDWFYYRRIRDVDPGLVEDRARMVSYGFGVSF